MIDALQWLAILMILFLIGLIFSVLRKIIELQKIQNEINKSGLIVTEGLEQKIEFLMRVKKNV